MNTILRPYQKDIFEEATKDSITEKGNAKEVKLSTCNGCKEK